MKKYYILAATLFVISSLIAITSTRPLGFCFGYHLVFALLVLAVDRLKPWNKRLKITFVDAGEVVGRQPRIGEGEHG
jgi:hypothetical protein